MLSQKWLLRALALSLVSSIAFTGGAVPASPPVVPRADVAPFRGLGAWVDIYDTAQWDDPRAAVAEMSRRGVDTLYLETGNYRIAERLFRPSSIETFLDAAHAKGIRVVAWYLPSFADVGVDYDRSMAAIAFRTSAGEAFDGFALDIEAPVVASIPQRKQRMLKLSQRIRDGAGPLLPLGAIIPSPYGMSRSPSYWGPPSDFPFRRLARLYDVIMPMSYFTWHADEPGGVRGQMGWDVAAIRKGTGDPTVAVHPIGGLAASASRSHVRDYVRSLRERGVLGASLYDYATTSSWKWALLADAPHNPRQTPPLPISLHKARSAPPLGNMPVGDNTHPKEVFFRSGPRAGALSLDFEAYDIQAGEVTLKVNWRRVTDLQPTLPAMWGLRQTVVIPDSFLRDGGSNVISFEARGNYPEWSTWGVRNVGVSRGLLPPE